MRHAAALLMLTLSTAPALADAVTYSGTLGTLPIVVELDQDPATSAGVSIGRYAYLSQGVDIPLAIQSYGDGLTLMEEVPCTPETCDPDDGWTDPTYGATWELAIDGDLLAGTWSDNGKSLPVNLTRLGAREVEPGTITSAASLAEVNFSFLYGEDRMTPENSPYDWEKMQVDLAVSGETDWDGLRFHYLTDPRVGLAVPRIIAAGDTPLFEVNAFLEARQFAMQADALGCKAKVYQGMGNVSPGIGGSLGGWDGELVEVTYLSPTVLAWTESGSLWCDAASPNNHVDYYAIDLATAEPLPMSAIFAGWTDAPPEALLTFIRENRAHDDAGWEADCDTDDLIGQYLGVRFEQGDTVTFALSGLPTVIAACGMDLYSAPLADLTPYLAASAATWFPELAD